MIDKFFLIIHLIFFSVFLFSCSFTGVMIGKLYVIILLFFLFYSCFFFLVFFHFSTYTGGVYVIWLKL